MPYPFQLKSLNFTDVLQRIQNAVTVPLSEATVEAYVTDEPVAFEQRADGRHKTVTKGEVWADKLFDCAWLHITGSVPAGTKGKIVLLIDFSGEGYIAGKEGEPHLGLTTTSSVYDLSLGSPGKKIVPITDDATGGEPVDLWIDAANNDLFGNIRNNGILQQAELAILNPELRALSYDFEVLHELMTQLDAKSARAQRIKAKLYEVSLLLRAYNEAEAIAARAVLAPELAKRGGDPSLTFSAVGHAHMDLGWLWPIRETKRKCARTFSTVLRMMERFPDYIFGASQPQQYAWVKEEYPSLYASIKEKVAEGRWEPQGAMWVEPDTNITGGESLIRQIIYGKQFFREEFGAEIDHLWEPDVFGYTGALPQILAKSGVRYFMTQKLSWNEINVFPHQTFWWEGIDGSRVIAHMLPEENYNSPAAPRSLHKAEHNYFDSPVSDHALILFGIGDGGGGPGEEHLERLARVGNLEGLCPVVQEPASAFFKRLDAQADKYVTWRGELYLEKHQGTLTSQGRNKRYNRKLEYLLREVELSAVWAAQESTEYVYPKDDLDRIWKEVLLYQFHDILPGSSITRVYDESLDRYAILQSELESLLAEADAHSAKSQTVLVNSLSWPREEWLELNGAWSKVRIGSLARIPIEGAQTDELVAENVLAASTALLENDLIRVSFSDNGTISSVFDKTAQREVVPQGKSANQFSLYEDLGDAWDFRIDFEETLPVHPELISREAELTGPKAVLRSVYKISDASTIQQEVSLTLGSPRIDFKTNVDWHETGKMLRTLFPVDVRSERVTCDIQFGTIQRPTTSNTTWDAAVHEIAAHKWVDLSEPNYGVALLNDCKYGHRVKGSVLNLNLLRSPTGPDPTADQAQHEFTYALFPHQGDAVSAQVMRQGYELNIPLRIVESSSSESPATAGATSWINVSAPSVVVETVKRSEDGKSIIVRLYESSGAHTKASIDFGFAVSSVHLVNLVEENPVDRPISGNKVSVEFGPFEIHTLKIAI